MSSCVVDTSDGIVVFEEAKSRFEIINKNGRKFKRHHVDGCLIKRGIRCDWLLVDEATSQEVFIELKGSNVKHAVDQLSASVEALAVSPLSKKGYVICTRSPLSATEIQLLAKRVLRSHRMVLRVKKTVYKDTIENIIS